MALAFNGTNAFTITMTDADWYKLNDGVTATGTSTTNGSGLVNYSAGVITSTVGGSVAAVQAELLAAVRSLYPSPTGLFGNVVTSDYYAFPANSAVSSPGIFVANNQNQFFDYIFNQTFANVIAGGTAPTGFQLPTSGNSYVGKFPMALIPLWALSNSSTAPTSSSSGTVTLNLSVGFRTDYNIHKLVMRVKRWFDMINYNVVGGVSFTP